jgi:hypothetical protein
MRIPTAENLRMHSTDRSIEKANIPSDLKCTDGEGHPVYLYVNKKE